MEEKTIDIPAVGQEIVPKTDKLSRRNFFKLAAVLAPTVPLTIKSLEKAFYEALTSGIKNPAINDEAISTALSVSEKAPNSENPNYRPVVDIIKEGISDYLEKSTQPAFFQRIEDYKGVEYYADVIKKFTSGKIIPQFPNKVADEVIDSLPRGAREAYFQSWQVMASFEELFVYGSGFDSRLRARHPELVRESDWHTGIDRRLAPFYHEGKLEIEELRHKVETKSKDIKQPVSASFIFVHFLEKNRGDISKSIFDTAIFLKAMARNNFNSGFFSPDESNIQWYKQNIKDEYQGPIYTNPSKEEAAINLIGKPYHSWNLVALLQFVPVEIVRLGGIQKQLSVFNEQGLGKTRSDLQTLENLREIEQLLLSYPISN